MADTGPLVVLAKLNHLPLLAQCYQSIQIPQAVYTEATVLAHRQDTGRITAFVSGHVEVIANIPQSDDEYLDFGLDVGETQAILLARRSQCPVLMDEKRGRAVAKRENVAVLGTLGLLLVAKQQGLIKAITPLLGQMQEHQYRLSSNLIERVKLLAGEE